MLEYKDLGQLLLETTLIDQEALDKAYVLQKKSKLKFGQILINMGALTEEELLTVLAKQLRVPFVDLFFHDLYP